jgi:hypothetical protein
MFEKHIIERLILITQAIYYLFSISVINSYLFMNNMTNLNEVHIELDIVPWDTSLSCGPVPAAC